MKNRLNEMKQRAKTYFPVLVICMLFSCVIYYLLISKGLVNSDDGLWEYDYYKGGLWSISLGRWFKPYFDRLRFGISTEPITSLITLFLYSLGLMFLLDLTGMETKKKSGFLVCALFMSSVVVCVSLSFRFMSPDYGMAFLLNIAAVWIVVKEKNKIAILAGGILIALGMGTYQAYIGCACLAFLGYLMTVMFEEQKSLKEIGSDVLKFIGAMVIGAIGYILVLNVHLKFFHLGMSDYNGGNHYSVMNSLQSLGFSIPYSYRTFFRYFSGEMARLNLLQGMGIFVLFFAVAGVFLIIGIFRLAKISKVRAVLFGILCAVIPLACNAMLLVATSVHVSLHMAAGMALCIPMLLCVEHRISNEGKAGKYLWKINLLIVLLIIYGNVYQLQADQEAMLAGRTSTTTIAETVIQRLCDTGNFDSSMQYCILGSPNRSELYNCPRIMQYANQYAIFGIFNSDTVCTKRSWQGVFSFLCNVNLEVCPAWEYEAVMDNPDVQNMPAFPAEGSILRLEDKIVVKISD